MTPHVWVCTTKKDLPKKVGLVHVISCNVIFSAKSENDLNVFLVHPSHRKNCDFSSWGDFPMENSCMKKMSRFICKLSRQKCMKGIVILPECLIRLLTLIFYCWSRKLPQWRFFPIFFQFSEKSNDEASPE